MQQSPNQTTPSQRVVARLLSEGWVECPGLGFPALSQQPLEELPTFILAQLQSAGGWMKRVDLQLATLIFSIPAHEFQFHPHLRFTLKRLETEGMIELQPMSQASSGRKRDIAIVLRACKTAQLG